MYTLQQSHFVPGLSTQSFSCILKKYLQQPFESFYPFQEVYSLPPLQKGCTLLGKGKSISIDTTQGSQRGQSLLAITQKLSRAAAGQLCTRLRVAQPLAFMTASTGWVRLTPLQPDRCSVRVRICKSSAVYRPTSRSRPAYVCLQALVHSMHARGRRAVAPSALACGEP